MMNYHTALLQLISFCLLASTSWAQNTLEETITTLDELNKVHVFADHRLITDWSGVRKDIKLSDFTVAFDTTASGVKDYDPNLLISQATITLFRHKQYTTMSFYRQGGPEPMSIFYTMARPGDRYEMQLTLVARRKTGEQVPLKSKLIYNLPLIE